MPDADEKLTLEAFLEHYSGAPFDDEEYAQAIVRKLPASLPVARAARTFLEAKSLFEGAMENAGIERG